MNTVPLRFLLVGALALGGLAACGSEKKSTTTPAPKASPTEAPLTSAQAKTIATASLLTSADLPGYKATPSDNTPDPDEDKAEAELEKCVGVESPDYLADESSDDFNKGEFPTSVEVSSEVQVVKTAAEGKADLQAFLSTKALGCFETFVGTALKAAEGSGVTVTKTDVERFDVAKPAEASDAFGLRVTGGLKGGGKTFTLSIEIVGALVGRAELSVLAFGLGDALAVSEQNRLIAVMATRAAKAQQV